MDKFIKTFMAVYETRNFSLAAKQLFISQPSVSVKIHQLEEQLGVVLFERNGHRQVRPTTAATHFYKTAEQLLQTWQQGTQEVQQLAAHPRKKTLSWVSHRRPRWNCYPQLFIRFWPTQGFQLRSIL